MKDSIPPPISRQIYQILVDQVGANSKEDDFVTFAHYMERDCREFRFVGNLGFGGKFYNDGRWRISCYSEDSNEERDTVIENVNRQLQLMYNEFHGG